MMMRQIDLHRRLRRGLSLCLAVAALFPVGVCAAVHAEPSTSAAGKGTMPMFFRRRPVS